MENKHIQPVQDYLLVAFARSYNDRLQLSGLALDIDTSYDPTRHLNIEGEVLAVPRFLSDLATRMKDPGFPRPKRMITADYIQSQIAWGSRRFSAADYSLANWEPEFEKLSDLEEVLLEGDTVFVDYTCLQPENKLEDSPTRQVYRVRYDNIIAGGRDGQLFAVGGYTLCIPQMQEEADITFEVANAQGEVIGLLTAPHVKPKHLRATVVLIDPECPLDVRMGDTILYEPMADWENEINGQLFYAIHERDYLAVIHTDQTMKPVGNRVIIQPKPADEVTSGGIIIPEMAKEKPRQGTIIALGADCKGLTEGSQVLFASGAGVPVQVHGQELMIMRDTDVFVEL